MRKLSLTLAFAAALVGSAMAQTQTGNVIFFHPDGTGLNHWQAARQYWVGPDASLNWDRLPFMAAYRGHMKELLVGTSNGGATTHAFGYKVEGLGSFGKDGDGNANPPTDRFIKALSGFSGSIMREAGNAGSPIAVINDGHIGEPGTGCFLAEVGNRNNWDEITRQIVQSRPGFNDVTPWVIMGGGEEDYLPTGVNGVHGAGTRTDGLNLIDDLRNRGYEIVRTRAEFEALKARVDADPNFAPKVAGIFARFHLFNDVPEERLISQGLRDSSIPENDKRSNLLLWGTREGTPGYNPPTIAEMTDLTIKILDRASRQVGKPFFIVAETESCDNFGNNANAIGALNAMARTDQAIGFALNYVNNVNPNTLIVTAADSDASGMQVLALRPNRDGSAPRVGTVSGNPTGFRGDNVNVPLDGLYGRKTQAFVAEPDQFGQRLVFAIAHTTPDFGGAIVSRAAGLNANLLNTTFAERFDNIDVYRLMYKTLFGRLLNYPQGQEAPDRN